MKHSFFLSLLLLMPAAEAFAQGLGGCASGTEQGYVTVTEPARLVYWRGGDRAGTVEPGDELRLCRYEGGNAIVTVWAAGIGFLIPRSAVSAPRPQPTLREVTEQDLACLSREIEDIQRTYRNEQDWELLKLARRRGVSLEMLNEIRMEAGRLLLRGQELPPCTSPATPGTESRDDREPAVASNPDDRPTGTAPAGSSRRRLTLRSAQITQAKSDGRRWDTGFPGTAQPLPDPVAELYVESEVVCSTAEGQSDTTTPTWNSLCSFSASPRSTLEIRVYDWDPGSSDIIGTWSGTLNDLIQADGRLRFGQVSDLRFSLSTD